MRTWEHERYHEREEAQGDWKKSNVINTNWKRSLTDANTWKIMFWKVKNRTVSHNDEKAKHSDTKQKKHLPYTIMFIINSLCISFTKVLETLLGYFGPLTWIIGADYLAAHPWWNLPFLSQDQESSEQLTHFCCPFLVSLCKLPPQCPVLS